MMLWVPSAGSLLQIDTKFGGLMLDATPQMAAERARRAAKKGLGESFCWTPGFAAQTYSRDLPQRMVVPLTERRSWADWCMDIEQLGIYKPVLPNFYKFSWPHPVWLTLTSYTAKSPGELLKYCTEA